MALYVARIYRIELLKILDTSVLPLFFLKPCMYEIIDKSFKGRKFLFAEPKIIKGDKIFDKFSNNFGSSFDTIKSTFSHFSH